MSTVGDLPATQPSSNFLENSRKRATTGGLIIFLGILIFTQQSSQASFDTGTIGTGSQLTDFRNVYSYYRSDFNAASAARQYHEAWAVGADRNDPTNKGHIFRHDGTKWSMMDPPTTSSITPPYLNAVAGQYDAAKGQAEIWVGGKSKIHNGAPTTSLLYNANTASTDAALKSAYVLSTIGNTICAGYTPPNTGDIYAIGAAQGSRTNAAGGRGSVLAGGQAGLLLEHKNYYETGSDTWDRFCSPLTANDAVTDITFSEARVGYITVTTNTNGVIDPTCDSTTTTNSKLYAYDNGALTLLGTSGTDVCFYGVSAVTNPTTPISATPNSRLASTIYVAASDGIYAYDESVATPLARVSTSSAKLYDVTLNRERGGSGTNLLANGNFEAWERDGSAPLTDDQNPSVWTASPEGGVGTNNSTTACAKNTRDIFFSVDKTTCAGKPCNTDPPASTTSDVAQGVYSLRLKPGIYYPNPGDCSTSPITDALVRVSQRINLSNIEGRKFRLTGKYKALYTAPATVPARVQAGVSLGCSGTATINSQTSPTCSFNNRTEIFTNGPEQYLTKKCNNFSSTIGTTTCDNAAASFANAWLGVVGSPTISGNVFTGGTSNNSNVIRWVGGATTSDQGSEAKIVSMTAGNQIQILTRVNGNSWYGVQTTSGPATCEIFKNNSGAMTTLKTLSGCPGVNQTIRLEVAGSSATTVRLRAFIDGVFWGQVDDTAGTKIDSGAPGLNIKRNGDPTSSTLDNWQGGFDTGRDAEGWRSIDLTFSRQLSQFDSSALAANTVANNGLALEVACEASYGTEVWCDDLKVEPVDEPVRTAYHRLALTAVGDNGLVLANGDVAGTGIYVTEANTSGTSRLRSVSGNGQQHVFAVGDNSNILQKRSGNVTGYLWVGTPSTGSTGATALGWISTNCAVPGVVNGLCDTVPESYGLSIEPSIEGGTTVTRLSGRAWFGKNYASGNTNDDSETVNAGVCTRNESVAASGYDVAGKCNTTTRVCNDSSNSCWQDADCYGHCTLDQSTRCVTNADCSIGADVSGGAILHGTTGGLLKAQEVRLDCSQANRNSEACTSTGWLSFNPVDFIALPPSNNVSGLGDCPNGGACLHTTWTSALKGWGRFTNYSYSAGTDPNASSGRGWVSLRGAPSTPIVSANAYPLYACKNCTGGIGAMSCQFCQDNAGQSCGVDTVAAGQCRFYCGGDPAHAACANDSDCSTDPLKSCQPVGYCSRTVGTAAPTWCVNDGGCGANQGFCNFGAVCKAKNPPAGTCNVYGVDYDASNGKLSGYAWSSDFGWIDFRNGRQGTSRFIQALLGDIYTQGRIKATESGPVCNATYLISATSTIQNFCSNLGSSGISGFEVNGQITSAPIIPFGTANNNYSNALGGFDLVGMETDIGSTKNKYGATIHTLSTVPNADVTIDWKNAVNIDALPMSGRIFKVGAGGGNTYVMNTPLTFIKGSTASNGAGMLVVNGNLRINKDLAYSSGAITDLRQLASLVVVVKGNLMVDSSVTNLVGVYYVTGTICTSTNTVCGAASTVPSSVPLTVRGLMMAKKFTFGRTFAGTIENPRPSELIIFDGRMQSNPLPGMIDFSNALPNTGANP